MVMLPKSGVQMMEDENIPFGENSLGGLLSDNTSGQTTRMETLFPRMKSRMKTGICLVSTNKNIITNLILTVGIAKELLKQLIRDSLLDTLVSLQVMM